MFKNTFHLFPKRSSGQKSVYGIFDCNQDPNGFIVTLPVPYLDFFEEGGDRNPLEIIAMFVSLFPYIRLSDVNQLSPYL